MDCGSGKARRWNLMTHYVDFGLITHNKQFVTLALTNELPPERYEAVRFAVQSYVRRIVSSLIFGDVTLSEARESFTNCMQVLAKHGVEIARRPMVEREERNAICKNVPHYDFMIVEGDEFSRRTLIHAAYESFALATIAEFVHDHRGEAIDSYMHDRLHHQIDDSIRLLMPNRRYGNRPGTLEFQREAIYKAPEDVPSFFEDRQRPAFRRPMPVHIGYKYHFYAPTHNFQIYICKDFRNLEMETCRAEGIDDWLPQSLRPRMS